MTITRYRKGQLSVPYLYTPFVDTLSGNLVLRQAGNMRFAVGASYNDAYQHIRLITGKDVKDNNGTSLLSGDASGHIDGLGRVDCAVTNPAGSQEVTLAPQDLVGDGQSGTLHEGLGYWSLTNTDDTLYLWLNTVFNYLMLLGTVHVETITVYINSDHNSCYITDSTFAWYSVDTSIETDSVTDPTDIGNGSSGNENGVLTVNTALIADHFYRLDYSCEATLGNIKIRAVTIKYRLT